MIPPTVPGKDKEVAGTLHHLPTPSICDVFLSLLPTRRQFLRDTSRKTAFDPGLPTLEGTKATWNAFLHALRGPAEDK